MEYLTLFARQTAFFDLILPERKYTEAFLGDLERARIPDGAGGAERVYTYSEEGEACV